MGEAKAKPLAKRLDVVAESTTLKLNALVQSLIAKGEKVVNLTAGEPDFPAPDAAKAAIREALDRNASKYTPVPGIPELRELVARKTNTQQPSVKPWTAKDVVVSNGGKQALFDVALALLNPGDEVIIPAPYWLSYTDIVLLAGGVPKIVPTRFEDGFRMSPEQLRQALTPKTKAVIFNSPSNPTGSMYSREQFAALGKVLLDESQAQGVWVISDEIYDRIILGSQAFASFLECAPELRDRSVTVNGLSKSGAMTGWRVGWSVAPQEMTQALIKIQGQSTSGINSLFLQ